MLDNSEEKVHQDPGLGVHSRKRAVATWRRTRLRASSVPHRDGHVASAWASRTEERRRRLPGGRIGPLRLGTSSRGTRRPTATRRGAWTWTRTTAWREWSPRKVRTRSISTSHRPRYPSDDPTSPLHASRALTLEPHASSIPSTRNSQAGSWPPSLRTTCTSNPRSSGPRSPSPFSGTRCGSSTSDGRSSRRRVSP